MKPARNERKGRSAACTLLCALLFAALVSGCSIAPPTRAPLLTRDFGPVLPAARPVQLPPLLVHETGAAPWLETTGIVYRLAYEDVAEPRLYANTRWVMPPAMLFTQRLRSATGGLAPADGVRTELALRVEILEFGQRFDAPGRSTGVLHARATLTRNGQLAGQRPLRIERPAPTPDAAGGVRALTDAADAAVAELIDWVGTARK